MALGPEDGLAKAAQCRFGQKVLKWAFDPFIIDRRIEFGAESDK